MREIFFDVWPGDDILGTSLGELTDASDKRYQHVFNNVGLGSFLINRHSAQYDWVTPGPTTPEPLIRVRRVPGGPFAYDDSRYTGAFFVEEGGDTLVSPDEEGGEEVARSGRTVESILTRAIVDYQAHYVDDIVNHPYDKTVLSDGQWHISEDIPGAFNNAGTPGAMLRIFLRNWGAMVPEPIPEVTHDFNINQDSLSVPWSDGSGEWAVDVGTDGLTILGLAVNAGIYYAMTPDLVLHAYEDHPGTDRSATITFAHAADIADGADRTIHASPAKSRVLVEGTTKDGRRRYKWVADPALEAVIGVRQGKHEYGASPTTERLVKAGQKFLRDLKDQRDGPPTLGVLEVPGQEAFVDYFPGDTVSVAIAGIYDDLAIEIHSITLVETETGECDTIVEFAGETWSGVDGSAQMGVCCATHIKPFVPGNDVEPGEDPGEGTIYVYVDNEFALTDGFFVNGTPMGFPTNVNTDPHTVADGVLTSGDNVVAAKILNGTGAEFWQGNPTGFEMRIFNENGDLLAYTTASAKVLPLENFWDGTINAEPSGWEDPSFDDSGWADAEDVTGSLDSVGNPMFPDPIAPARTIAPPGAKAEGFVSPAYSYLLKWLVRVNFTADTLIPVTPVTDQIVWEAATGDGSETCFFTNHPYLANSLRVFVGGIAVAATQTDPATGEFCLPFVPPVGTQILIHYTASAGSSTGATNQTSPSTTTPNIPLAALPALTWKQPARVATTGDVTIATALNAGDTIDGVTLAVGDRVLVKSQTDASQNGVYIVGPTPIRVPDFDDGTEVLGAVIYVIAGTVNGGQAFRVSNLTAPTIATDDITFATFGGSGAHDLDSHTDVVITSPATLDRLHYDGTDWVNTAAIWRPVLDGATGAVLQDSGTGEAVMALN